MADSCTVLCGIRLGAAASARAPWPLRPYPRSPTLPTGQGGLAWGSRDSSLWRELKSGGNLRPVHACSCGNHCIAFMRRPPRRLHPSGRPSPPPPPLIRSLGDSALPHIVVLNENEPAPGVVLWQLLRDVTLWASIPPGQRSSALFNDSAGCVGDVVPELHVDLGTLDAFVREAHPDAAAVIGYTCYRIAQWAEARGCSGTALEFVQAAALADRSTPTYAYEVAKLSRRRGDGARSSVWFSRAGVLARRAGDWETLARSYAGLGNLFRQLGNLAAAAAQHERSLRVARRYGLRELRGDALYDLCVLRYESGDPAGGAAFARKALRAYGRGHARIPQMAHDVAVCWMDHQGRFADAFLVLRQLLERTWRPADGLLLMGSLARAAAGVGDRDRFESAWTEVQARIAGASDQECHAAALVDLARGAALLGDSERAMRTAELALTLARERREGRILLEAEAVLGGVRAEESARALACPRAAAIPAEAESLASEFTAALRQGKRAEDEATRALREVMVNPTDPGAAYRLARHLRSQAEYVRSIAWFERAVVLAEHSGDRSMYIRALGGLANLYRQRGNLPEAVAVHERALDVAGRSGESEMEGEALYDLCVLHFEMGDGNAGFACAREAIRAYGPGHPRIPKLTHDVAVYLIEGRGDYANALTILRELSSCPFRDADRLLLHGNTARAAAGAGEVALFEKAWDAARGLLRRMGEDREHHAAALISLSHAALIVGRIEWAERTVEHAHEIASARQEARLVHLAEGLRETLHQAKRTRARIRPFSDPQHDVKDAAALAREFAGALRVCVAPGRRHAHPSQDR